MEHLVVNYDYFKDYYTYPFALMFNGSCLEGAALYGHITHIDLARSSYTCIDQIWVTVLP